ncbi:MAG TPA: DUF1249 domain-containing protein [Pseudomonadales bacterium]
MTAPRYRVDLAAHMAECDANYLRLVKLAPGLDDGEQRLLVLVVAERRITVRIALLERCPYTSLIEISQHPWLDGLAFELPAPRLLVRMYHDARSAEVVEFQTARRFHPVYAYPNDEMRHRDEKAQINRFLAEYLSACLYHGVAEDAQVVVGG